MAGPRDRTDEAALWRRWRSASASAEMTSAAPDALLLAAYADRRLPEEAADAVEDWLAAHPEAMSDILAARRAGGGENPPPPEALVARAAALVAAGGAQILTFPQAARRRATW